MLCGITCRTSRPLIISMNSTCWPIDERNLMKKICHGIELLKMVLVVEGVDGTSYWFE